MPPDSPDRRSPWLGQYPHRPLPRFPLISWDLGEPSWDLGEPSWDRGEPSWDRGEPPACRRLGPVRQRHRLLPGGPADCGRAGARHRRRH